MSKTVETPVTASCEIVDKAMEPTNHVTQLSHYASDPTAYLRENLGAEGFEERKQMLCLPTEVDLDRYGGGAHKQHFEQHIATMLGKQHGLFFVTGVQAQLAALKGHCNARSRQKAAWHVSSHLEDCELSAYSELYGLQRQLLGSDPTALPTVKEITEVLDRPVHERPAAVLIEVPNRVLGCQTYTFSELEQLSQACRKAGVAFHMDGARLWEVEPYYRATADKSFAEIGALFDSIYVSFYKALGGATGAMLASNDLGIMDETKIWQRRAGGNAFSLGYQIIDCERGFNENIGLFARRWQKMQDVVAGIEAATASYKTDGKEPIISFMSGKPTCCQVITVFNGFTGEELIKARDGVDRKIRVRVFERLRPKQSLDQMIRAQQEKASGDITSVEATEASTDDRKHFVEWFIMNVTFGFPTEVFVDAYRALCEELLAK
ncbi:hypothetical protein LTR86_010369 [Recurvomyces mirabilis]|nr:hypothetical protein LTR86_010369 [Recurvomyces mirabilis]